VLAGDSAEAVARELRMTRNAVFIAKHRTSARLRELLVECEAPALFATIG
jgi:hypothetical protein